MGLREEKLIMEGEVRGPSHAVFKYSQEPIYTERQRQCCDDTSDTALIKGVAQKFKFSSNIIAALMLRVNGP